MVAPRGECAGRARCKSVLAGSGGSDYLRDSFASTKAHRLADCQALSRVESEKARKSIANGAGPDNASIPLQAGLRRGAGANNSQTVGKLAGWKLHLKCPGARRGQPVRAICGKAKSRRQGGAGWSKAFHFLDSRLPL